MFDSKKDKTKGKNIVVKKKKKEKLKEEKRRFSMTDKDKSHSFLMETDSKSTTLKPRELLNDKKYISASAPGIIVIRSHHKFSNISLFLVI